MTDEERLKYELLKDFYRGRGLGLPELMRDLRLRQRPMEGPGTVVERLYAEIEAGTFKPY